MKLPAEEEDKPKPNQPTPNKKQKPRNLLFFRRMKTEEEICDIYRDWS